MEKLRCLNCAKVVGEAEITTGTLRKICPKCKSVNMWDFVEITSLSDNKFSTVRSLIQKLDKK